MTPIPTTTTAITATTVPTAEAIAGCIAAVAIPVKRTFHHVPGDRK